MQRILTLLNERPLIGAASGLGGGLAAVLTVLKVVSVVFGAAGAIVGFAAAVYTLKNQRRFWREHPKTETPPK